MNPELRIPGSLLVAIRADLERPHPFAFERVGFLFTRCATEEPALSLATGYQPVDDRAYLRDDSVGARIGGGAIHGALQGALTGQAGAFHVHLHDHLGEPALSQVDRDALAALCPPFCALVKSQQHGALLLSRDQATAYAWRSGAAALRPCDVVVVGYPMQIWRSRADDAC